MLLKSLSLAKYPQYYDTAKRMASIDSFGLIDFFSIANLATLFFCAVDFAFCFTRWDACYTEDIIILILITAATAAVLDFPMMGAGKAIRKMQCGLIGKRECIQIVVLAVLAFLLAFGFSMWFSYATKDLVFSTLSSGVNVIGVGADAFASSTSENQAIEAAAWFSAVLPACTSLASLLVTLFAYDPVKERRKKITRACNLAKEHLRHINQSIAEAEALGSRTEIEIAKVKEKYGNMVENTMLLKEIRCQAFRQALMEGLHNNDDINRVIDNAVQHSNDEDFSVLPLSYVEDVIKKEKDTSGKLAEPSTGNIVPVSA